MTISKERILEAAYKDETLNRSDLPKNIDKVASDVIKVLKKFKVGNSTRFSVFKYDSEYVFEVELGDTQIDNDKLVKALFAIKKPKHVDVSIQGSLSPAPQTTISVA